MFVANNFLIYKYGVQSEFSRKTADKRRMIIKKYVVIFYTTILVKWVARRTVVPEVFGCQAG